MIGLLALAGCATADPPPVVNACQLDLKKACQNIMDNGHIVSTDDGITLTHQRLQNISVRHLEVMGPYFGGQLRCIVDTQTARVTDAHLSSGPQPQLNDAEIASMRQKGMCE